MARKNRILAPTSRSLSKLAHTYSAGLSRNHEVIDMKTPLRFALLAGSALAGFSFCLEPASAASSAADACAAVLMNRSAAIVEQFVREYPVDSEACLATATTSHGFAFGRDRAGQGYGNAGNFGHGGNSGSSGHSGGQGGSSGHSGGQAGS